MFNEKLYYVGLAILGLAGPFLFPDYTMQIAVLWVMVLMASTWDIMGGQMGYNSLGNITFFGVGMYISAAIQVSMFYDLGLYTAIRCDKTSFHEGNTSGFIMGVLAAGIGCVGLAILLGLTMFGLRGPYFAIGTLGVAVAAREIAGTIEVIGAGAGIAMPFLPLPIEYRSLFYLVCCFCVSSSGTFCHSLDVLPTIWFGGKCYPR